MTLAKSLKYQKREEKGEFGRIGFHHRVHRSKKNRRTTSKYGAVKAFKKRLDDIKEDEAKDELEQARVMEGIKIS